jgi:hypothetical protein
MPENNSKLSRRRFLLTVGAGSAAGAAALVAGRAPGPRAADTTARRASGYQETAHVRNYYRTAKI